MQILLVTHYYMGHGGGIEIVAGELARRLARRGATIRWAASGNPDAPLGDGITPLPAHAWHMVERVTGFSFPLWSPSSLTRLWSAVAECDLVHIHEGFYPASLFAYLSSRLLSRPAVITQHMGQIPRQSRLPFSQRLARWSLSLAHRSLGRAVLGRCNRCVFISPKVKEEFTRLFRFRHESLYIPNGVDQEIFYPLNQEDRMRLRAELGWSTNKTILLFVGRFIDRKGLPLLRELASEFTQCEWVFVGKGPHAPAQWGLTNVRCPGTIGHPELAAYYQAADLLILPSVVEGFPLVVQEAMACGTPSLVTGEVTKDYPAIHEVVFRCGPTRNQFTALLASLLANPSLLESQRSTVASFAQKNWDWERCADQYLDLFTEVLETHTSQFGRQCRV